MGLGAVARLLFNRGMRRVVYAVIEFASLAIVAAAMWRGVQIWNGEPPDRRAMRAHMIGRLSDEQIRQLYERAKLNVEERQRLDERSKKEQAEKFDDECRKAGDIAYKMRHPEACKMGIRATKIYDPPSVDQEFEYLLMMGCLEFATTVRAAKNLNCLPP